MMKQIEIAHKFQSKSYVFLLQRNAFRINNDKIAIYKKINRFNVEKLKNNA